MLIFEMGVKELQGPRCQQVATATAHQGLQCIGVDD
jgi:hypothetical protein